MNAPFSVPVLAAEGATRRGVHGSEPRRFSAPAFSQPQRSGGSQFHAIPPFVLGAIESLIGGLDHLLGLAITSAGFGDANADRHRKMIGLLIHPGLRPAGRTNAPVPT